MKYIFIVGLLLCAVLSNAQVYKFRALRVGIKEMKKNVDTTTQWQKCDYLIVFQPDKINLYKEKQEQFDIIKGGQFVTTDKLKVYGCDAVDDEGRKCTLMYYLWEDDPIKNSVLIKYPGFTYYFDVQKTN